MFIFSAMITAAEIKFVKSLQAKKKRYAERLFVVEGKKMVTELLKSSYNVKEVYNTEKNIADELQGLENLRIITEVEMKRISGLDTPTDVLAIVHMPDNSTEVDINNTVIALENIQDPGNLGSIIRTADWFGVRTIFCSENTVDIYNSKVVQASMGSLFRVSVKYCNLISELNKAQTNFKTCAYATVMNGENAFQTEFDSSQIILFGNEGKGISEELLAICKNKITIPAFSDGATKPESLNVAASVAVMLTLVNAQKKK